MSVYLLSFYYDRDLDHVTTVREENRVVSQYEVSSSYQVRADTMSMLLRTLQLQGNFTVYNKG